MTDFLDVCRRVAYTGELTDDDAAVMLKIIQDRRAARVSAMASEITPLVANEERELSVMALVLALHNLLGDDADARAATAAMIYDG